MIKIEIPNADLEIKKGEYNLIPEGKGGVYYIYNNDGSLAYVGQSGDLKVRIHSHFIGASNTSKFSGEFSHCKMFYEESLLNREIYEYYLINTHRPEVNLAKKRGEIQNTENIRLQYDPPRCKGYRTDGGKCKSYAHMNGYCHSHGGNGITFSSVRDKAVFKVLEEERKALEKEQPTAK